MLKALPTERSAPVGLFSPARPDMARRGSYLPWTGAGAAPGCCDSGNGSAAQSGAIAARPTRARLKDLKSSMHCSVIGTCLGGAELRKLVTRLQGVPASQLTELEVHHAAVEQAVAGGDGAKLLNKMLDQQHALHIQRFAMLKSTTELEQAWRGSVQDADIPGPYWALMTHPAATEDLRKLMFGEVHMLSHLQGVGNRADLVRLRTLELENAELRRQLDEQQERLQRQAQRHQKGQQLLEQQRVQQAALARQAELQPGSTRHATLEDLHHRLIKLSQERDWSQQTLDRRDQELATLQTETDRLQEQADGNAQLCRSLRAEVAALESTLNAQTPAQALSPAQAWQGARVLYVGGRPSSNGTLQRLAKDAGLELIVHDGGLEDRKGLLPGLVPGCDLALLPVDCVDHDSMNVLKRLCVRHGVPFRPLRTAGIASFLAALEAPRDKHAQVPIRRNTLCIRHA